MLAKKLKLPIGEYFKKREFRGLRSEYFSVRIFQTSRAYSRFTIIISKKVCKKAVDRNKFKRLFFSFVSEYKNQNVSDFLFITSLKACTLSKDDFFTELNKTFKMIKK